MQEIGIAEKHALNFLEQYNPAYVSEKLQVLTERQQIEDVISPSGFFIRALEEDWKSEKLEQQQQEDERRTKEEEKRRLEALEKRKHELAYEFGKVIKKEFLASLTAEQEAELLTEIKSKHEGDYFILGDIEKKGLNSMMLAGRIMEMIPNYNAKREVYIRENLNKR
jgi:hypothetical protein